MKYSHQSIYNPLVYLCVMLCAVFFSCSDDSDVRPNADRFLRMHQSSVTIHVGEQIVLKPSVDTIAGKSYNVVWSVADNTLASVEKKDQQQAVITGLQPGSTTLKVETSDHQMKYFADLTVLDGEQSIKLLTIGSRTASQSANEALVRMARATNKHIVVCNVYRPQTTLADHLENINENAALYTSLRIDEEGNLNSQSDKMLREVITSENWDYIAIEEDIDASGDAQGYAENIPLILEKIQEWATNPNLKCYLHMPWAYNAASVATGFMHYDRDQMKMYKAIVAATHSVADQFTKIAPVGTAIQNARTTYLGESVLNDDINLNATSGAYISALTWYETLFGTDVTQMPYNVPGMSEYVNKMYKQCAHSAVTNSGKVTDMVDFKSANPFVLENPIFIDFGTEFTPLPFNSFVKPDKPLSNLIDTQGNSTYFNIEATTPFNMLRRNGFGNRLGMPPSVYKDMFFRDGKRPGQEVGGFKMSGLNTTKKYTFMFYGAVNDHNTGTRFTLTGVTSGSAEVSNDYNEDKLAIIKDIQPKPDGTIDIEVTRASFNTHWGGFYGVNALIIVPEGYKGDF
ncbi:MAG: DUF4886 domain-containing protein [Prevotella sp.]|jgi:hypothetical protein